MLASHASARAAKDGQRADAGELCPARRPAGAATTTKRHERRNT